MMSKNRLAANLCILSILLAPATAFAGPMGDLFRHFLVKIGWYATPTTQEIKEEVKDVVTEKSEPIAVVEERTEESLNAERLREETLKAERARAQRLAEEHARAEKARRERELEQTLRAAQTEKRAKTIVEYKWEPPKKTLRDIHDAYTLLRGQGIESDYARDMLAREWLKETIGRSSAVALLIGNPHSVDAQVLKELPDYIRSLAEKNVVILFDADSPAAAVIARNAPQQAIGITAVHNPRIFSRQHGAINVHIQDPSLRALAMKADYVIATPDSLPGLATLFDYGSRLTTFVSNDANAFEHLDAFSETVRNIRLGAHLRHFELVHHLSDAKQIEGNPKPLRVARLRQVFQELSTWQLADLSKASASLAAVMRSKRMAPKGMCFFGSGRRLPVMMDERFDAITAEYAQRGLSISTGGGGGTMEQVSELATSLGRHAFGVGGGGSPKIVTPLAGKEVYVGGGDGLAGRHTLLMDHSYGIRVGPGGSGTMAELASAFHWINQTRHEFIAFEIAEYYGDLVSHFKKHFPDSIRNRIFLVDRTTDLEKPLRIIDSITKLDASGGTPRISLQRIRQPLAIHRMQNFDQAVSISKVSRFPGKAPKRLYRKWPGKRR